jgi:hypothetical protein
MTPDPDYDDEWLEEVGKLKEVAEPQIEEWARHHRPTGEDDEKSD